MHLFSVDIIFSEPDRGVVVEWLKRLITKVEGSIPDESLMSFGKEGDGLTPCSPIPPQLLNLKCGGISSCIQINREPMIKY